MNIEHDYLRLLKDILDNGRKKEDRTGTGTISVFGRQIRHKMNQGFPLLTTKKMYWKGIVTELLWFLRGDTNIKYLVDNDCHIWDGDAYKAYQSGFKEKHYLKPTSTKEEFIERIKTDDEFAKKWGDLGPVYGKQWRDWTKDKDAGAVEGGVFVEYEQIDQIKNLIEQLKTNPDSRRLMVNAWNVGELDQMTLPPCHYGFQVYTRELSTQERYVIARSQSAKYKCPKWDTTTTDENGNPYQKYSHTQDEHYDKHGIPTRAISLMWNQRSVDTFLGLPFNITSYGLLLEIIAKGVNMVPDELIGNLGDVHLYKNHVEQAKEQLTREPKRLPRLEINSGNENWHLLDDVNDIINSLDCDLTFKIKDYQPHSRIKAPLSN
jgi:thymidylate synthase